MIITIDVPAGICEVVDWDDPNTLKLELTHYGKKSVLCHSRYEVTRPEGAVQFFPFEELEALGNQLIESEERFTKLVSLGRTYAEFIEKLAAEK